MGNVDSSFHYISKKFSDVEGYYLQDVVIELPIKIGDVIYNGVGYFIVGYSRIKKRFTTYSFGEVKRLKKINEEDPNPPNKNFVISLLSGFSFSEQSLLYYYDRQNSEGTVPYEIDLIINNVVSNNMLTLNKSWRGVSEYSQLFSFDDKKFIMKYSNEEDEYNIKFIQCYMRGGDKKLKKFELTLNNMFDKIRESLSI